MKLETVRLLILSCIVGVPCILAIGAGLALAIRRTAEVRQ